MPTYVIRIDKENAAMFEDMRDKLQENAAAKLSANRVGNYAFEFTYFVFQYLEAEGIDLYRDSPANAAQRVSAAVGVAQGATAGA